MITKEGIEVKLGQVWRDLDPRMNKRERIVISIEGEWAVMAFPWDPANKAGRTKVLISRMHSTQRGWTLIRES